MYLYGSELNKVGEDEDERLLFLKSFIFIKSPNYKFSSSFILSYGGNNW